MSAKSRVQEQDTMQPDAQQAIAAELVPGETMQWAGQPIRGASSTTPQQRIAYSIVLIIFLPLYIMLASIIPLFGPLFPYGMDMNTPSLLILIGSLAFFVLFLLGLPILIIVLITTQTTNRRNTFYAITDQRIIVITGKQRIWCKHFIPVASSP
jgi:hypothetical protein